MGASAADAYPILPLPYNVVLFPGRTLHLSPANRSDVISIIANYYSGALNTKSKDNAPLIACVPLCSPYLSRDGRKLIDDGNKDSPKRALPDANKVTKDTLFNFGTLAKINGIRGGKSGDLALVVEGVSRCKINQITQDTPFFEAKVTTFKDEGQCTCSCRGCCRETNWNSR